jgi:crossover junction endodeoxyribonuclease RusA
MRTVELPWPPSANSLRAIVRGRSVKTKRHREYVDQVKGCVLERRMKGFGSSRLSVHVDAYPPDRRKRDIDNCFKAILDGLCYAGVYHDDSQIDRLSIERREIEKGGRVLVRVEEL